MLNLLKMVAGCQLKDALCVLHQDNGAEYEITSAADYKLLNPLKSLFTHFKSPEETFIIDVSSNSYKKLGDGITLAYVRQLQ